MHINTANCRNRTVNIECKRAHYTYIQAKNVVKIGDTANSPNGTVKPGSQYDAKLFVT